MEGLRAQAFTGAYGSKESTRRLLEVNGADVISETTRPLPMRGGLTIDIYIPQGVLKAPTALTKFFWFIGSNPIRLSAFLYSGCDSLVSGIPSAAIPIPAFPWLRNTNLPKA